MKRIRYKTSCILLFEDALLISRIAGAQSSYDGKYFSGTRDKYYIELLDKAYRMMRPDLHYAPIYGQSLPDIMT